MTVSASTAASTRSRSHRWRGRGLYLLFAILILGVHTAGRVATVCAPSRHDSFYYTIAAYRFWQPDAGFDDLIPDKPPGQALLTGWVFRLLPGPPSRLTMVPVESAFLLGAYLAFYLVSSRVFGRGLSLFLTLVYALMQNTYNSIDYVTDGFSLNENYLAAPLLAAVLIHLCKAGPATKGLGRGIALGLAMTIKQTAGALLLALLLHDVWRSRTGRQPGIAWLWAATAAGVLLAFVPIGAVLIWNGWAWDHAADLLRLTGKHVVRRTVELPEWSKLQPLAITAWCLLLGFGCRLLRPGSVESRPATQPDLRDLGMLAACWLAAEAYVLWSLTLPAAHYYQQLAAPACLLAGVGLETTRAAMAGMPERLRKTAWDSIRAGLLALTVLVALPLISLASLRVNTFDARREAQEFAEWLDRWSPASAADHLKREQHEPRH